MKKSYLSLLADIRPFVKIPFPVNKKNFTTSEKRFISYYHNKTKSIGLLDTPRIGYLTVNASDKAPKIKGAPKIKKMMIDVGVVRENGKLITDPRAKVVVENGRYYVKIGKKIKMWRFYYDISQEWTIKTLTKELNRQIGKAKNKEQFFAIGAGLKYTISPRKSAPRQSLEQIASEILRIGYGYVNTMAVDESAPENDLTTTYEHKGQIKNLSDWMQQIQVFEGRDVVSEFIAGYNKRKIKSKKRKKRKKGTGKRGKKKQKNSRNR